ncbi:hypothetical protein FisN_36Lh026 [Fistulifera solaris]|uniref:DUF5880 domain-containing protein n=1 Tax=Fistulifera solaris TaxID=1519565 RepID=A0A1Z5JHJ2_FISSO|nr:hypothetical protein FisN_36Lh026 [Fistulifera solaris]|eukprot:GAX13475.1 hypothetical protein FisN_36Lh026 [Fistulifera solaris]
MSTENDKTVGADLLAGVDIGAILASQGPVVKCVLLRHARPDGKDIKPHPAYANADELHQRQVLTELVEEIELDTTPSKSAAAQVLGGPFTFIGQFPTEGTVVMARREIPDDAALEELPVAQLRKLCHDFQIDTKGFVEKTELVNALSRAQLPLNPHLLQPPLDGIRVFGDILIMKVAETEEELDQEDDADDEQAEKTKLQVPSNQDFFLDYTRKEYIHFASRTDVVAPEVEEDDDEEEEDEEDHDGNTDDDDDDDEEDFVLGEDEDLDEEERSAMLNMLLSQVIKKFRDEHGRGPNTKELLELRGEVAGVLGVEVATFDQITSGVKHAGDDDHEVMHSPKKVKFSNEAEEDGAADESEDSKPFAQEHTSKHDEGENNKET